MNYPDPQKTKAAVAKDVHERGQADVKFHKLLQEHERAVYFAGVNLAISNAQNALSVGYGRGYRPEDSDVQA